MNVSLNLFSISGKQRKQIVPVHNYDTRYAEAFTITKIRTFKHEQFLLLLGAELGGGKRERGVLLGAEEGEGAYF